MTKRPASKRSPEDYLIIQLAKGADQDKFDQLLKEVDGKVVNTIDAGSDLKFLVIETEPAELKEAQEKFKKSKEVAAVQRNSMCHLNDTIETAGHSIVVTGHVQENLSHHQSAHHPSSLAPFGLASRQKAALIGHGTGGSSRHVIFHSPKGTAPKATHQKASLPEHPQRSLPEHVTKPSLGSLFGHGNRSTPAGTYLPVGPISAAPSTPTPITGAPTDKFYSAESDLSLMNFQNARSISGAPQSVPVAMYFLDTGIQPYPGETQAYQFDYSNSVIPTGYQETPFDSGTHGTSTTTVTATTDNKIGYAGEANIEGNRIGLTMLRISADGESASMVSILAALARVANGAQVPGPVNLSFGNAPPNTLNSNSMIQSLAQQLRAKGFLLVLASGNDGPSNPYDPSPEQYARRVAAVNADGSLAYFSDTGAGMLAAAPGVQVPVYTANSLGSETFGSGTSFSAPRWCAAIADVMGALPANKRTAVAADQLLLNTGTSTSSGYKIPNIQSAINAALGP
jgi:hypothetical protein